MKGYWIVTIIQKHKSNYSDDWLKETWKLNCVDLETAQDIIDRLEAVWPPECSPMKVAITWHEMSPNTDTIPDTDFMEGGDS